MLSETRPSTYQLQIGGMSPFALPAPGVPLPQPMPSGVSITTPQSAMVTGAAWPPTFSAWQRIARAKTSGAPLASVNAV